MLPIEQINHNIEAQKKQLSKFLQFDPSLPNHAEIVNNYDWFQNITFLDFIRDIGKHITVNYMMSKDSVQNRLESGMSFTEFSYQLVQGYDFYYLNQHKNVRLQMGGSDQWGNIIQGVELSRRADNRQVYALTQPLLMNSAGQKMGKSVSGAVWLDGDMLPVFDFWQYWRNADDADIGNYGRGRARAYHGHLGPDQWDSGRQAGRRRAIGYEAVDLAAPHEKVGYQPPSPTAFLTAHIRAHPHITCLYLGRFH